MMSLTSGLFIQVSGSGPLGPLVNLNTHRNIFTLLHSNVEQVKTMCSVQDWKQLLSYFSSDLPWNAFFDRCVFAL